VNKQIPSYLKLVTDTITQMPAASVEDLAGLAGVCQAFEQATGWRLEYTAEPTSNVQSNLMWSAPVNPGVGNSPGHIRLFSSSATDRTGHGANVGLEQASQLAEAVGQMWGELLATRRALRQREAELATGVPLVLRDDEDDSLPLAERIEAVVRSGAEALGCQAAALYLLDSATTELKLRSSWGLAQKRLTEPARPLRGSLADLEALLGHAVVLASSEQHEYWKVPERQFAAAVCVPVSSSTMPIGTLWVYSRQERDFAPAETNLLEVVAGRLAIELERQVLIDEALAARDDSRQIITAQRAQQEQLPRIAPMVEGWEIAATVHHAGRLGGTFYDWFALDDGALAVLAGDAMQRGLGGALVATALRSVARAQGPERQTCHALLEKANSILWTGSAGGGGAAMFQAIVEPASGTLAVAAAGPLRLVTLARNHARPIITPQPLLGCQEMLQLAETHCTLSAGDLLLVYGCGSLSQADGARLKGLETRLMQALSPSLSLTVKDLVEIGSQVLADEPSLAASDRLLLAIKRRH
jgi:phosphoserine phosphatase RsbU/P